MANAILEDLTRLRCALATVYFKKTSNKPLKVQNSYSKDALFSMLKAVKFTNYDKDANIDGYARDKPLEETEELLAEGEELHPSFRRRSAGILRRYGQDLSPQQQVEVRIPAEPSGFNRSEYRAMSSGLAKGRPRI
jgi:hypothetical protein